MYIYYLNYILNILYNIYIYILKCKIYIYIKIYIYLSIYIHYIYIKYIYIYYIKLKIYIYINIFVCPTKCPTKDLGEMVWQGWKKSNGCLPHCNAKLCLFKLHVGRLHFTRQILHTLVSNTMWLCVGVSCSHWLVSGILLHPFWLAVCCQNTLLIHFSIHFAVVHVHCADWPMCNHWKHWKQWEGQWTFRENEHLVQQLHWSSISNTWIGIFSMMALFQDRNFNIVIFWRIRPDLLQEFSVECGHLLLCNQWLAKVSVIMSSTSIVQDEFVPSLLMQNNS